MKQLIEHMKRKKHRLSSKLLVLLLFLVISSSTVLVANAFLRHSYLIGNRAIDKIDNLPNSANGLTPGIDSTSTTTSTKGYTVPIQAHHIPATAVASASASPNKNSTVTSTNPVVKNGATLPPGSALPADGTCASQITRSSFEPRPDNNTA